MTFDLHTLDDLNQLGETFELKCKLAHGQNGQGEVPKDFWLTYSAVANSHGGVVLLGVREKNGVFTLSEGRTLDLHDSFEPFDHTVLVLHYSPTTPEKTPEKNDDRATRRSPGEVQQRHRARTA